MSRHAAEANHVRYGFWLLPVSDSLQGHLDVGVCSPSRDLRREGLGICDAPTFGLDHVDNGFESGAVFAPFHGFSADGGWVA